MTETTRVRLHGGRVVHAVKESSDHIGHLTGCAIYISPGAVNHWMPDTTTVTCGRCSRGKIRAA